METLDKENSVIIFTDGSSLGNPGNGGWGALLIYKKMDEVIELGGSKPETTNNAMELTAIVSALSYALHNTASLHLFTDSQYAINGITKWMYGWAKNGWQNTEKEDIKNKRIWQTLYELVEQRGKHTLHLHHVRGHVGIPGNERVDEIARFLAEGKHVPLYRGRLSEYPILDVLTLETNEGAVQKRTAKGASAYSYLSLIDGVLAKHKTWAECEARVSGQKAQFKKALSPEHEQEILTQWGVKK
jgi:ribonuclease HI